MSYQLLFFILTFSLCAHHNFILIGPPGGGKGTFSSCMVQYYDYYHICPGDIVRSHIKNNTQLGKIIKPIVERGDYVDDTIMFEIIKTEIESCCQQKKLFILDGFPRNQAGLHFLIQLFKDKGISSRIQCILFKVNDEDCINRINDRLVCFKCFAVYNAQTNQPKIAMTCNICNSQLEVRLGDTLENTKKRLLYYRKNIEPLAMQASEHFILIKIDSSRPLTACLETYKNLMLPCSIKKYTA